MSRALRFYCMLLIYIYCMARNRKFPRVFFHLMFQVKAEMNQLESVVADKVFSICNALLSRI